MIDGFLYLYDRDCGNARVDYQENGDGTYCLEYYADKLYVCGPTEPLSPIMGRTYEVKYSVASSSKVGKDQAVRSKSALSGPALYFEDNQGQIHRSFDYLARAGGLSAYLFSQGAVFCLSDPARKSEIGKSPTRLGPADDSSRVRRYIRMTIASAEAKALHRGENKLPGKVNYFRGPKSQWKTNVPTYGRVCYDRVLPGVDVAYHGRGQVLEYDFIVAPGADPTAIALKFEGQSGLKLDNEGDLVLAAGPKSLTNKRPLIYQVINGRRKLIQGGYRLLAADTVGFSLGAYDPTQPLVIDPEISYCGYIGGSGDEYGNGIAVDSSGAIYLTGFVGSTEATFPVVGGLDSVYNGSTSDAYIAKVSADGSSLVYCGYIGGSDLDYGQGVAVDSAGAAYVTGYTQSTEATFPVIGGPDTDFNLGDDAFIAKVSADGSSLVYCGYIGGTEVDRSYGVAVDSTGAAYVVGYTSSKQTDSFPVIGGPDLTYNGSTYDTFVAKVSVDGLTLVYCGYIGGSINDIGQGIAVDSAGAAYVIGRTTSTHLDSFPVVTGPDLSHNGGSFDVFVAKVNADGLSLAYCGYIGGSNDEDGSGIAVDSTGAAYVTGYTRSREADSFPVLVGPDLSHNGAEDAFIAKVSSDGSSLAYCGYIGGSNEERGLGVAVDASGAAYVTGHTQSTEATFPVTVGPDLSSNGNDDAFIAKVSADGSGLAYCGYIGGSNSDKGYGIAVDVSGSAYVAGVAASSESDSFPVTVGPSLTHGGGFDAFVAKVGPGGEDGGGDGDGGAGQVHPPGGGYGQWGGGRHIHLTGYCTDPSGLINQARTGGTDCQLFFGWPFELGLNAAGAAADVGVRNSAMPWLMVQWTRPDGGEELFRLPIGQEVTTSDNVVFTSGLSWDVDIRHVYLRQTVPAGVVAALGSGKYSIKYWLQDADGAKSNPRIQRFNLD